MFMHTKKMQIHNLFNCWNKLKFFYYVFGNVFLNGAKRNSPRVPQA